MPFKKLGKDRYQGPSGKIFTKKQVRLYYARGGTFDDATTNVWSDAARKAALEAIRRRSRANAQANRPAGPRKVTTVDRHGRETVRIARPRGQRPPNIGGRPPIKPAPPPPAAKPTPAPQAQPKPSAPAPQQAQQKPGGKPPVAKLAQKHTVHVKVGGVRVKATTYAASKADAIAKLKNSPKFRAAARAAAQPKSKSAAYRLGKGLRTGKSSSGKVFGSDEHLKELAGRFGKWAKKKITGNANMTTTLAPIAGGKKKKKRKNGIYLTGDQKMATANVWSDEARKAALEARKRKAGGKHSEFDIARSNRERISAEQSRRAAGVKLTAKEKAKRIQDEYNLARSNRERISAAQSRRGGESPAKNFVVSPEMLRKHPKYEEYASSIEAATKARQAIRDNRDVDMSNPVHAKKARDLEAAHKKALAKQSEMEKAVYSRESYSNTTIGPSARRRKPTGNAWSDEARRKAQEVLKLKGPAFKKALQKRRAERLAAKVKSKQPKMVLPSGVDLGKAYKRYMQKKSHILGRPNTPTANQLVANRAEGGMESLVFNIGGKYRYADLDGRQHLVVPVAMLKEGVWPGSDGPLFYPEEENARQVMSWNHKPLVCYHPTKNGRSVTASDPDILNTRGVGLLLNVRHDTKLRGEAWIDVKKSNKVDPTIVSNLLSGRVVEVSTGLFVDKEHKTGNYKGTEYIGIARNHRPDHLAILPTGRGAMSVADGAGLNVTNQRKTGNHFEDHSMATQPQLIDELIENEASPWVEEDREFLEGLESDQFNKVLASVINAGPPMMEDDEYEDDEEEETPPAPPVPMKKKKKGMPMAPPVKNQRKKAAPVTNDDTAAEDDVDQTLDSYVSNAPPEIQEILLDGIQTYGMKRAALVDKLVANKKCPYSKDELVQKPIPELQKMVTLMESGIPEKKKGSQERTGLLFNYRGQFTPETTVANGNGKQQPLGLPTLNFSKN